MSELPAVPAGRSKGSEAHRKGKMERNVDAGGANNAAEVAEGMPDFRNVAGLTGSELVWAIRGAGIPEGTSIRPWLILGSAADAADEEFLRRERVAVMITSCGELAPTELPFVRHHVLPVADRVPKGEYQRERLREIHKVIGAWRAALGKVPGRHAPPPARIRDSHQSGGDDAAPKCLLHCVRGRSRSVVACLAHLMWAENLRCVAAAAAAWGRM